MGILLSQYLVFWYSCIFGNMVIWNMELDRPVIHNFRNFQFSPNITTILIIAQLNWFLLPSLFPFIMLFCLHTLLIESQVFCAVMSPTASTWAHKISSPTFPLSAAAARAHVLCGQGQQLSPCFQQAGHLATTFYIFLSPACRIVLHCPSGKYPAKQALIISSILHW